jgi:hypothetical protein
LKQKIARIAKMSVCKVIYDFVFNGCVVYTTLNDKFQKFHSVNRYTDLTEEFFTLKE